jgi:endo-1,4-beta-xylanase
MMDLGIGLGLGRRQRGALPGTTPDAGITATFVGSNIGAASATVPALQAGDIILAINYAIDSTAVTDVTPDGFIQIDARSFTSVNVARFIASFKIADGTEDGSTITGMDENIAEMLLLAVLRPSAPVSVALGGIDIVSANADPTQRSVAASSGAAPLVVVGFAKSSGVVTGFATETPAFAEDISVTLVAAGLTIYNGDPQDHVVDMADFGTANTLGVMWFELEVLLPLEISGTPILTAEEDVAYAGFTVAAVNGIAPHVYSLVGTWPAGLSINPVTGAVSGTPTEDGIFPSLSVRVTDAALDTDDLPSFTLSVAASNIYFETMLDPNLSDQTSSGSTIFSRAFEVDNGVTINSIGLYLTNARETTIKIARRNSAGNYDIVVSEAFSHPGGGWVDHTLATPYLVPESGDFYPGAFVTGTTDRRNETQRGFATGDLTGTDLTLTESTGPGYALRVTGLVEPAGAPEAIAVDNIAVATDLAEDGLVANLTVLPLDNGEIVISAGDTDRFKIVGRELLRATTALEAATSYPLTLGVSGTAITKDVRIITGLVLDLNPANTASLTLTGSAIDAIAGSNGTAFGATGSGATRPTIDVADTIPVIAFDGTQYLDITPFAEAFPQTGFTIAASVKLNDVNNTTYGIFDVAKGAGSATQDRVNLLQTITGANGYAAFAIRKANATANVSTGVASPHGGQDANNQIWRFALARSPIGASSTSARSDYSSSGATGNLALAYDFDIGTIGARVVSGIRSDILPGRIGRIQVFDWDLGSVEQEALFMRHKEILEATIPAEPLYEIANTKGLQFGSAMNSGYMLYGPDSDYLAAMLREYDIVVPEFEMKWRQTEAVQGVHTWTKPDDMIAWAQANGKAVRGHAVIWHNEQPLWLPDALAAAPDPWTIMEDRIVQCMTRYSLDEVQEWDVCNEVININDGNPGGFRDNVFYQTFGSSYIADTFTRARELAPTGVKLFINEYGLNGDSVAGAQKRADYLALIEDLKANNVPLDGVGLQSYLFQNSTFDPVIFEDFLDDIAATGVEIAITEFSVFENITDITGTIASRDQIIADRAAAFFEVALAHSAVKRVLTWLPSDRYTNQISNRINRGRIYDAAMMPKQLYGIVKTALQNAPVR